MAIDHEAVVREVLDRLEREADEDRREKMSRYMSTSMLTLGVRTPDLREVTKTMARRFAKAPPDEVIALALALRDTQVHEARQVGLEVLGRHRAALAALDAGQVERLGRGMDNWGTVDALGCLVAGVSWRLGALADEDVHRWADSRDHWWRRLALVATLGLNQKARGGEGDTDRTIAVCELLVDDHDDMVIKGMSWALRELGERDPASVKGFLKQHGTALAPRIRREVNNKLKTGLKNPRKR